MKNSPPIGTEHIGYETMQEEALMNLSSYQEKRYLTRGMYLI